MLCRQVMTTSCNPLLVYIKSRDQTKQQLVYAKLFQQISPEVSKTLLSITDIAYSTDNRLDMLNAPATCVLNISTLCNKIEW